MTTELDEDKKLTPYSTFLQTPQEDSRLEGCFSQVAEWVQTTLAMTFTGQRTYDDLCKPTMQVLRASLLGDENEFSISLANFHQASKQLAEEMGFTMPELLLDITESILNEAVSLLDTLVNQPFEKNEVHDSPS